MEWKTEWNRTGTGTNILYKGVSNRWTGIWNGTVEWKWNGTELALVQIYKGISNRWTGIWNGTVEWKTEWNRTGAVLQG